MTMPKLQHRARIMAALCAANRKRRKIMTENTSSTKSIQTPSMEAVVVGSFYDYITEMHVHMYPPHAKVLARNFADRPITLTFEEFAEIAIEWGCIDPHTGLILQVRGNVAADEFKRRYYTSCSGSIEENTQTAWEIFKEIMSRPT